MARRNPGTRTYRVKSGDTYLDIANALARLGIYVDIRELINANLDNQGNARPLIAGAVIKVPAQKAPEAPAGLWWAAQGQTTPGPTIDWNSFFNMQGQSPRWGNLGRWGMPPPQVTQYGALWNRPTLGTTPSPQMREYYSGALNRGFNVGMYPTQAEIAAYEEANRRVNFRQPVAPYGTAQYANPAWYRPAGVSRTTRGATFAPGVFMPAAPAGTWEPGTFEARFSRRGIPPRGTIVNTQTTPAYTEETRYGVNANQAMPPWAQIEYYGPSGGSGGGGRNQMAGMPPFQRQFGNYGAYGYNVPMPASWAELQAGTAPTGFVESRFNRDLSGRPIGGQIPGQYSGYVPGENGRAGYYVGYDPRTGTRTPTRGAREYEWFDTTAPELRWVWGY